MVTVTYACGMLDAAPVQAQTNVRGRLTEQAIRPANRSLLCSARIGRLESLVYPTVLLPILDVSRRNSFSLFGVGCKNLHAYMHVHYSTYIRRVTQGSPGVVRIVAVGSRDDFVLASLPSVGARLPPRTSHPSPYFQSEAWFTAVWLQKRHGLVSRSRLRGYVQSLHLSLLEYATLGKGNAVCP